MPEKGHKSRRTDVERFQAFVDLQAELAEEEDLADILFEHFGDQVAPWHEQPPQVRGEEGDGEGADDEQEEAGGKLGKPVAAIDIGLEEGDWEDNTQMEGFLECPFLVKETIEHQNPTGGVTSWGEFGYSKATWHW